jgi:hypothetical protein
MNFKEIKLNNPGILETRVSDSLMNSIDSAINSQIFQNFTNDTAPVSYSKNLVGHLSKEYAFKIPDDFKTFLELFALNYGEYFSYPKRIIQKHDAWVNLQQKHEFNPIHVHNADLSWVLWFKIPYKLSEEDNLENSISSSVSANARFMFHFTQLNGMIRNHTLNVDKTYEGKLILFPSYLPHSVFPFYTSDEFRISIAGNIIFK